MPLPSFVSDALGVPSRITALIVRSEAAVGPPELTVKLRLPPPAALFHERPELGFEPRSIVAGMPALEVAVTSPFNRTVAGLLPLPLLTMLPPFIESGPS